MIVCCPEPPHALSLSPSRWLLLAIILAAHFFSVSSLAHGPFDSSARITVMEQTIEATVTVGTDLGKLLLKDSGIHSLPNSGVGMGKIIPVELATRLFEIEATRNPITASQVRVLSDGLESTFIVTYPRPDSEALRMFARFSKHLPASAFCALVVVDDSNQMLSSHIVKLGSEAVDFSLPKLPSAIVATTTANPVVSSVSTSSEIAIPPPSSVPPSRWSFGILVIVAGVVAAGGWRLVQKALCREQH